MVINIKPCCYCTHFTAPRNIWDAILDNKQSACELSMTVSKSNPSCSAFEYNNKCTTFKTEESEVVFSGYVGLRAKRELKKRRRSEGIEMCSVEFEF